MFASRLFRFDLSIARVGALAAAVIAFAPAFAEASDARPNIVLIVADDLGYGDLGLQGGLALATPRLDQFASEGARMTDFYAAHSICAPSRAGLMTGRYQQRFGFEWNPGPQEKANPAFGIPAEEPTLAERLKAVGYRTGAVGKWHLGFAADQHPLARGFDSFYGFLSEAMAYTREGRGPKEILQGREPVPMVAHTTEAFAEEAAKFIATDKDRPYFLYVAFNATHAPLQATDAYLQRFADEPDMKRRTYFAMLAAMDDAVGRIVDAVEASGGANRTLVIFTSDNGAPSWQTTGSNGPLNGVKATFLEGGIRVPTLIRWTGAIPAGRISDAPGIGQDISATILEAAGARPTEGLDGVDLLPIVKGDRRAPKARSLFWRAGAHGAMREGRWKLVHMQDDFYLFDLSKDFGERRNLAAKKKKRTKRMRAEWEAWSATLTEPRFVMPQAQTPERLQGFKTMLRAYVETGEPGIDPRTLLYGGGPE